MNVLDTRNLTYFRRHQMPDGLHADFGGDFGFRDSGSRFSILLEEFGSPGPDEAFAHVQTDARSLFEKLLGLEVEFPCEAESVPLWTYRSTNHYRSHLHEYFHWSTKQHQASVPVAGECRMCFAGCDDLMVTFRLRNTSRAQVPVRMSFFSKPCAGSDVLAEADAQGFRFGMTQAVRNDYDVRMRVDAMEAGTCFGWDGKSFRSEPIEYLLEGGACREWTFRCRLGIGAMPDAHVADGESPDEIVAAAIARSDRIFSRLVQLEGEERRFEALLLRAAGILQTNRSYDADLNGNQMMTIHAGKTGVSSTWWWDGAIHLMGLGLSGDAETVRGAAHILLGGVREDGFPSSYYNFGLYDDGVQMPILAWGISHAHDANPDRGLIETAYPVLQRYARWWLRRRGDSGLVTLPNNGTAQDDSPRWATRFPIEWESGETWDARKLATSRPGDFESPDVNAHLYLELRALERMALELGLAAEAAEWAAAAEDLGTAINELLLDPETGMYQDRHIASGRFTGYLTAGCFIPIYAGLAPQEVARRACREYLLNPERFYTTLPFAGVDRSHAHFLSGGRLYEEPRYPGSLLQSAYWLGRVWLQYSYWLTGALWQSGMTAEADAAADKILDTLSQKETLYECYDPLTGTGNGHPEFSWGAAPVLGLIYRQYRRGAIPSPAAD